MLADGDKKKWRVRPEWPFLLFLMVMVSAYLGLLVLMVGANVLAVSWSEVWRVAGDEAIQKAIRLSLVTSTATALLSVLVAVPVGYFLSRYEFRGKALVDSLVDIPILLPPLTVGLSLLIVFNQVSLASCLMLIAGGFGLTLGMAWWQKGSGMVKLFFGGGVLGFGGAAVILWGSGEVPEDLLGAAGVPVTFRPVAVVLAQFPVAVAFAIRMMRTSFDEISPRYEAVAMSLGCCRGAAFRQVILPMSGSAILAAGTMAWARALGEFGPILIFAGATRGRTEVLSTSVYLELNVGNVSGAAVLSLLMIVLAVGTIFGVRLLLGRGGRE